MRLSLSTIILSFLSFVSSLPTGTPDAHTLDERAPEAARIWEPGDSFEIRPITSNRPVAAVQKVLILYVKTTQTTPSEPPETDILYLTLYTTQRINKNIAFVDINKDSIPWGVTYDHQKYRPCYYFDSSDLAFVNTRSLTLAQNYAPLALENHKTKGRITTIMTSLIEYLTENKKYYSIYANYPVKLDESKAKEIWEHLGKHVIVPDPAHDPPPRSGAPSPPSRAPTPPPRSPSLLPLISHSTSRLPARLQRKADMASLSASIDPPDNSKAPEYDE